MGCYVRWLPRIWDHAIHSDAAAERFGFAESWRHNWPVETVCRVMSGSPRAAIAMPQTTNQPTSANG